MDPQDPNIRADIPIIDQSQLDLPGYAGQGGSQKQNLVLGAAERGSGGTGAQSDNSAIATGQLSINYDGLDA